MKKIIFIFFIIISIVICPCFAKNNRYLVRNYEYYYDLSTFKYDSNNNTTSINVIYNIDSTNKEKRIKSPFDNNHIQYLIFATELLSNSVANVEYKGFVTGEWSIQKDSILFQKAKIYYNKFLIPNLNLYIQDFKNCADLVNYKKDLDEILNAYKNNRIYKLPGSYSTLNRYNDI